MSTSEWEEWAMVIIFSGGCVLPTGEDETENILFPFFTGEARQRM